MSTRLKRNADVLKVLCRAKPQVVKAIIRSGDRELIQTLCECCLNILKGGVRLTPHQKEKLRPHKQGLRVLAAKTTSLKRRKNILQKGGFLGAVLGPVLGMLGQVLLR